MVVLLLLNFVFSSIMSVLFIRVFGWSVFVSSLKLIVFVGDPNVICLSFV